MVSPDLGKAKDASLFARLLKLPMAAGVKQRIDDETVVIDMIVGEVANKKVIIMDDEIATGGTILELLEKLRESHVTDIQIVCTHAIFSGRSIERFRARADIWEIVTTNTVPIPEDKRLPNMTILSIAPLLAETIRRIHNGESVSGLFAGDTG